MAVVSDLRLETAARFLERNEWTATNVAHPKWREQQLVTSFFLLPGMTGRGSVIRTFT